MVANAGQYPQLSRSVMTPAFLKDNGRDSLLHHVDVLALYNTFVMKANLVADDFQR